MMGSGKAEEKRNEEREVQKNEKELIERKTSLDREEQDRKDQKPMIYKVDPFYEVETKPFVPAVISLGLYGRKTWNNFKDAIVERENLKLDVAIKFMADIGKKLSGGWVEISEKIVKEPTKMKNHYDNLYYHSGDDEYKFMHSSDAIQSALALDAIFVTSFLLCLGDKIRLNKDVDDNDNLRRKILHDTLFENLKQTMQLISRESQKFTNALYGDIFKLENQIPLELIRNTIQIIFAKVPESERNGYEADQIFDLYCEHVVVSLRLSCFPSFKFEKIAKDGPPKCFTNVVHKCGHLLHCLAHALWEEAEPELDQVFISTKGVNVGSNCDSGSTRISNRDSGSTRIKIDEEDTEEDTGEDKGEDPRDERNTNLQLVTATELHKCGITIKAQPDLSFFPKLEKERYFWWRATLFLPQIHVLHEYTEQYWMNFLAFEEPYIAEKKLSTRMSNGSGTRPETSFLQYLTFMNELINTKDDVILLCTGKDPIIRSNQLGDYETVADLFNSLTSRQNNTMGVEWRKIRKDIMEYHNRSNRVKMVEFTDTYFGRP